MTTVRSSAVTHIGKVRNVNEDSILALPEHRIWLVSDGMGGHNGGDFASQTVADAVAVLLPADDPSERMVGIRDAIGRAHNAIISEAARRGTGTIGATVVALLIAQDHFVAFWAGDSRLYRLRDGVIEMLTTDHSFVADLVEAGQMTWDEAELHPHSNAINRAVGVGEDFELDKIRGDVQRGDRFLLCSDGLSKYATFATLQSVLDTTPIETVTDKLLNLALAAGGADNISIIVVDIV